MIVQARPQLPIMYILNDNPFKYALKTIKVVINQTIDVEYKLLLTHL